MIFQQNGKTIDLTVYPELYQQHQIITKMQTKIIALVVAKEKLAANEDPIAEISSEFAADYGLNNSFRSMETQIQTKLADAKKTKNTKEIEKRTEAQEVYQQIVGPEIQVGRQQEIRKKM